MSTIAAVMDSHYTPSPEPIALPTWASTKPRRERTTDKAAPMGPGGGASRESGKHLSEHKTYSQHTDRTQKSGAIRDQSRKRATRYLIQRGERDRRKENMETS